MLRQNNLFRLLDDGSCLILCVVNSSVKKGTWWMPWQSEAMKDVVRCDKSRGAAIKL